MMNAPGHSIGLAVTLGIMVAIAPHEASARGGVFHLLSAWSPVSRAEAGTGTHHLHRRRRACSRRNGTVSDIV
jgi:hypothetical protein